MSVKRLEQNNLYINVVCDTGSILCNPNDIMFAAFNEGERTFTIHFRDGKSIDMVYDKVHNCLGDYIDLAGFLKRIQR